MPIADVMSRWGCLITSGWAIRCACRHHRRIEQVAQADQVLGNHMHAEHWAHLFGAEKLELVQTDPWLDRAKHLLNAAVGVDLLGVSLVAGGATLD
jgi:hypothetical protein